MNLVEQIVDTVIREMINIDEIHFALVTGRGTTDAILIIPQLQEEYLLMKDLSGKNRILYYTFVDLEKAFNGAS